MIFLKLYLSGLKVKKKFLIVRLCIMETILIISKKKYILKYERKMPEKEVLKMKSFITNKGDKLIKTEKFKIVKINDKDNERIFEVIL